MKRIAAFLLIALGGLAGFARWLDLVNYTDPAPEFVLVGSVWLRYGAMAALLVLAALAALLVPGGSSLGVRRAPGLSLLALLCSTLFAAVGAAQLLAAPFAQLPVTALSLLTAWWMAALALNWLEKAACRPTGGIWGGIFGTALFYLLTLQRFAANGSSYHRVGPMAGQLAALLALVFLSALLRAVQRPQCGNGRKLVFSGLACFYLCSCVRLPQAIFGWLTGSMAVSQLALDAALAAVGLLGATAAFHAVSFAQPVAQQEEKVQA